MRVVIAESQESVRSALRLLVDEMGWNVVGEVARVDELMQKVTHAEPDVVLLEWELPGFRAGVHLYPLRSRCSSAHIIALSNCDNSTPIPFDVDLIVCKNYAPDALFEALRRFSDTPFAMN